MAGDETKKDTASEGPVPEGTPPKDSEPKKEPKAYKLKPRADDPKPLTPPEGGDFIEYLKQVLTDARLENEQDDELGKLKARFSVHDEKSAAWAAGKIVMWNSEVERRKHQVREWVADAERSAKRVEYLFKDALEAWARKNLPKDKKSIKLPTATLSFRKTEEKLEVVDEKRVLNWATINCPDAIHIKREPLLDPLKEHYKTTEKVPEGCEVVPEGENFHVK